MKVNQYVQHLRAPELISGEKDLKLFRSAILYLKAKLREGNEAAQAKVILAIYRGYLEATLNLIGDDAAIAVPDIPEDPAIAEAWERFLAWQDEQSEG